MLSLWRSCTMPCSSGFSLRSTIAALHSATPIRAPSLSSRLTIARPFMADQIFAGLRASFERARESGHLLFFPSTTENHGDPSGLEFQIRMCPALMHKPKLDTPHFDPEKDRFLHKKPDPFAPPYNTDLYVGELGGDYVILLNKYSVVEEHFLLVTKNHQSQLSPLFPPDLIQTYDLLLAAQRQNRYFFAFYNCGDVSGASQHHKHLQFVPCESSGPPIERLARVTKLELPDRPFTLSSLPYANHVARLPHGLASLPIEEREEQLAGIFLSLVDLAIATVRHDPEYPSGPPSYNVVLTLEHIHVIPRKRENYTLATSGEPLSVNSMGFAGYILVKSDAELEAVKREGLANILRGVALESVHDLQVEGTAGEV